MSKMRIVRTTPRQEGFSLVEMLIVVSIISMLLGMLYSAIRSVQRYSRESVTRGELKSIESAWKQYYAHYQCWPTGTWTVAGVTMTPETVADDIQYSLDAPFARMLEGRAITNDTNGQILNSEAIAFLELTRFDTSGAPVNAWGMPQGRRYSVVFDLNGDNLVPVLTNAASRTTVPRAVAVWTEHPDKAGRTLGSWER
jgi:prepilin-type N-terminal cleavage/methylation domain-containing protein